VLPSDEPSVLPSDEPSLLPSDEPSVLPSDEPSLLPSDKPSVLPSDEPSVLPSDEPSVLPSDEPSVLPSDEPSVLPSDEPSLLPSDEPSVLPSDEPSVLPSDEPSVLPSDQPSDQPSNVPSNEEERGVLFCKIDEDGIPIPPSSPKFTKAVADPVYSSAEVSSFIQNDNYKEYGETFPEYFAKVYKWLSLWSNILPSGKIHNLIFVEKTMKGISDEALAYLGEVKKFHEETFGYPSDDHIGLFFEEETRNLGEIRTAFQDFVSATMATYDSSSYEELSLIQMYTKEFR